MRKTIMASLFGCALSLGTMAQCTPPVFQVPASLSVCSGQSTAALNFTSDVDGAVFSWSNSNPSIGLSATGSGNINAFQAINTGSSDITSTLSVVAISGSCSSAAQSITITVKPSPPQPSISPSGNLLQSNGGGSSYVWYYNNSPIDGAGGSLYAAFVSGSYTVQVLSANGCPSPPSQPVNLVITALSNLAAGSGLRLFANPVRNQAVLLQEGAPRIYTVSLLNMRGILLQSNRVKTSAALNMSAYPAGTYLLAVRDERTGQVWQQKIVHL
jgi:hypothetical protein